VVGVAPLSSAVDRSAEPRRRAQRLVWMRRKALLREPAAAGAVFAGFREAL